MFHEKYFLENRLASYFHFGVWELKTYYRRIFIYNLKKYYRDKMGWELAFRGGGYGCWTVDSMARSGGDHEFEMLVVKFIFYVFIEKIIFFIFKEFIFSRKNIYDTFWPIKGKKLNSIFLRIKHTISFKNESFDSFDK